MNNKKLIMASLFSVAALTLGASTFAYQGNPGLENPDCTDTERHAAVEEMFANKDYTAFQSLYADKGVSTRITTQDQFEKFTALRDAQLAGATDEVATLKAELNLGQRKMDGTSNANGEKRGNRGGNGMRDGSGQGNGGGRGNK